MRVHICMGILHFALLSLCTLSITAKQLPMTAARVVLDHSESQTQHLQDREQNQISFQTDSATATTTAMQLLPWHKQPLLTPDAHWHVLGPFPTGMREQDFGADPLEAYGGFLQLAIDNSQKYPSELADGGMITWRQFQSVNGRTTLSFPDIRWQFLEISQGWRGLQYQAWARHEFVVPPLDDDMVLGDAQGQNRHHRVQVYCNNVGELYVDQDRFTGDWYNYGLVVHTLDLAPGNHVLSVRVSHEIRIFGGAVPPLANFECSITLLTPPLSKQEQRGLLTLPNVEVVSRATVIMDRVGDQLAGDYMALTLRNSGVQSVVVTSVKVSWFGGGRGGIKGNGDDARENIMNKELALVASLDYDDQESVRIVPSAHRPIRIRLDYNAEKDKWEYEPGDKMAFQLVFSIQTGSETGSGGEHDPQYALKTPVLSIRYREWGQSASYRFTFLDFDQSVHYAIAIPPRALSALTVNQNQQQQQQHLPDKVPVLVALHGAGVETSTDFWTSEFHQGQNQSWIVLPTGRSPWGYDWHGPSFLNIQSALSSLAQSLPGVPHTLAKGHHNKVTSKYRPDLERLFLLGHSNGGQGAWFFITHYPDLVLNAILAAGYMNIRQYVSYGGWVSHSFTDSATRGLLESAIAEFDNNLYISNIAGIPILGRIGGDDENVPPHHTRAMVRLAQEHVHKVGGKEGGNVGLSEIPRMGHWFDGALYGKDMKSYISHTIPDSISNDKDDDVAISLPELPTSFELITLNPASMGTRGGIQIEQLELPFRVGKIRVERTILDKEENTHRQRWKLETKNIRRFGFPLHMGSIFGKRIQEIAELIVDEQVFTNGEWKDPTAWFVKQCNSDDDEVLQWVSSKDKEWLSTERHRQTYGPAIQILEKKLIVVVGTEQIEPSEGQESSQEHPGNTLGQRKQLGAERIARLIADDIYLYGRADVEILTDVEFMTTRVDASMNMTNLILIGDPFENLATTHVLSTRPSSLTMRRHETKAWLSIQESETGKRERWFTHQSKSDGVGVLMIHGWGNSNLAMVIAGYDLDGLDRASKLFPKRTGQLIPDWVVVGPEMGWKGAGGLLGAGYWNQYWQYSSQLSV